MADESISYDNPKPKSGIGKAGIISIIVGVMLLTLSVTIILGELNKDQETVPDVPGVSDSTTDPSLDDTDPGNTDVVPGDDVEDPEIEDVIRELTSEEKIDVVKAALFGEDVEIDENYLSLVNNECVMEVDGELVDAIKLICEAKVVRKADGVIDHRTVSISAPINDENRDMNADQLAEYFYNNGFSNMQVKNDVIEGAYTFGTDTYVNSLDGSRYVREYLKEDGVITEDAYEILEATREMLCVGTKLSFDNHFVHITDMVYDEVNARGDVNIIIYYDVYDMDGKLVGHWSSKTFTERQFIEDVEANEIFAGEAKQNPYMEFQQVDANRQPLVNQEISK